MLPDYKLIGPPRASRTDAAFNPPASCKGFVCCRKSDRGKYHSRRPTVPPRGRAVRYIEGKIRKELLASDPTVRTASVSIGAVLKEYTDDSAALGNSEKQIATVTTRINRVIKAAKLKEYGQVDPVVITKAVRKLMKQYKFGVTTGNKYIEAMRAWTRWMQKHNRWPVNNLENLSKLKGDTSPKRQRAILTDDEFAKLLQSTKNGPYRRKLSPEQRMWLWMLASQTGLRAQELNSLTPTSFDLDSEPATITVHCTISKRRTTDTIVLRRDFAEMLRPWIRNFEPRQRLWGSSSSWWYKAASILRADLAESGIDHLRGSAQIDFHSFRCYRVTRAILSGKSSRVVMIRRSSVFRIIAREVCEDFTAGGGRMRRCCAAATVAHEGGGLSMSGIDLSLVDMVLREQAREAFAEGDAAGLLICVGNHDALAFVTGNIAPLCDRGIYEQALLDAFTGARCNHAHWPIGAIHTLFHFADSERLRGAGQPLPAGEKFTVFRGVSGAGRQRRISGLSWTLDFSRACWFAVRLELDDPAVYSAVVPREIVLCYCNERHEQEVVCRPAPSAPFFDHYARVERSSGASRQS